MGTDVLHLVQDWLVKKRFPPEATLHFGQKQREILVFLPKSVVGKIKASNKTSIRHMGYIKRMAFNDLGVEIQFRILSDVNYSDIESGLCAIIRNHLQSQDVKAFLISSLEGKTDVWLESISPIIIEENNLYSQLKEIIVEYLNKVGLSLHQVYWDGPHVPSSVGILKVVKILAPVAPDEILKRLAISGYSNVPLRWLTSRLDSMRRNGLIAWFDGQYVVTNAGLSLLPKSRGRLGSDVERALALARRQWQNI